MLIFTLRRLGSAAAGFVGATAAVFMVTFALPGDPARLLAGERRATPASIAAIRVKYGLDDSLPEQYLRWMSRLVRGDLGPSLATKRPVATMLLEALPVTARLVAITVVIEALFGLVWGTWGAVRAGRGGDHALAAVTSVAIAAPTFVVASVAQYLLGVRWQVLPVAGTRAGIVSYLLPAFSLGLAGFAMFARLVRTSVGELAHAGHVRSARGKGISEWSVYVHHVLRCGLTPLVAFLGLEFAGLLGGAIIVERTFNLPGLGGVLAKAIAQRDQGVVVGATVVIVVVYLLLDVAVDAAAMLFDPRLGRP